MERSEGKHEGVRDSDNKEGNSNIQNTVEYRIPYALAYFKFYPNHKK